MGMDAAQPACLRVPAEILLEILAFLATSQDSLYACALTCRQWRWAATRALWRRPHFRRLLDVERLTATLLDGPAYARLIETLSFSTLPEPDRSNPHLATLLDSIVGCMGIAASSPGPPPSLSSSSPPLHAAAAADRSAVAASIARPRGLWRDEAAAARPHSAVDLHPADPGAACCATVDVVAAPRPPCGAGGEPPHSTVDDTQLSYPPAAAPAAAGQKPRPGQRLPAATALRQLDLRFCKGVRNYSLQRLAPKLGALTVLNLAGGLRTDITIAKLAQHMGQLRRISLAWTSNLTDFGVAELVQRCRAIECLDLTYCTQIEDTAMFAIAHSLRGLVALSVAYCGGVSDAGVAEVAAACPALRVLNVAKCLRVSDRARALLEHQRVVARCDSLEPFSIHSFAARRRPRPNHHHHDHHHLPFAFH
ncbi:hypothetical protein H4R18_001395 [Coemansia javaensis]|uniref:F-box domain-containing protein n=1 Tax=Coemansia javaensis TaxID=2761396 RepID=A0A9W8HD29_9FUNG|nr:hypothetical protein H4R18_001395 [Coemansia javaensis]